MTDAYDLARMPGLNPDGSVSTSRTMAETVADDTADRLARAEAAFVKAQQKHAELLRHIDDGDDQGDHVGAQRHRRAVYDGQAEILTILRDTLGGDDG